MELSIIIPTYNERENMGVLIPQLERSLKECWVKSEIIIVDDDSPDKTGAVAQKLNERYGNIVVVIRKHTKGIASAWYHGYNIARGRYIATMDADLCHKPKDLMCMYRLLKRHENEYDIVIGSRYIEGGRGMKNKNFVELTASRIAQIVTRVFLGMKGYDLTHSFRIFKKGVFHSVKKNLKNEGNVFLVEFIYSAWKKGYRIKEIPIDYGKRRYGITKLNVYKEGLRFFIVILFIFFKDRLFHGMMSDKIRV